MVETIWCCVCREHASRNGADEISRSGGAGRGWRCAACQLPVLRDELDAHKQLLAEAVRQGGDAIDELRGANAEIDYLRARVEELEPLADIGASVSGYYDEGAAEHQCEQSPRCDHVDGRGRQCIVAAPHSGPHMAS